MVGISGLVCRSLGLSVKSNSKLTRESRSKLTHLQVLLFPGESFLPGIPLRCSGSARCNAATKVAVWCEGVGPAAVVPGFDDIAAMGEAVEQGHGHPRVPKHLGPFLEGRFVVMISGVWPRA